MSNNARRPGAWLRPRAKSAIVDYPEAARSHVIRTARALIGTTPAQLAAHMGATRGHTLAVGPDSPVESFDDLARVLHVLVGWYEGALGGEGARQSRLGRPKLALDEIVRRYLALRSEWEQREAVHVAAAMAGASPIRQAAPPASTTAAVPMAATHGPSPRRALLVDDSADILVTVGSFLQAFGFEVLSASSGDAALAMLLEEAPIDLLVTDYAMPGMTGKDLALEACRSHPHLRALIITGYPDLEELSSLPDHMTLLAKPFRRAQLSARIQHLFDIVDAKNLVHAAIVEQ